MSDTRVVTDVDASGGEPAGEVVEIGNANGVAERITF
jgi:hypothetical protein